MALWCRYPRISPMITLKFGTILFGRVEHFLKGKRNSVYSHPLWQLQYLYLLPFSWSVGASPTMTMSPTSSVPRCCVLHFLGPTGDLFVLIWQPCVEKRKRKWRERGIVNWFGACELVWYLEIMCIFSHESIEKSLPHNLQEPNSRGEDIAEDGEREVLCIDLVLVNWFDI